MNQPSQQPCAILIPSSYNPYHYEHNTLLTPYEFCFNGMHDLSEDEINQLPNIHVAFIQKLLAYGLISERIANSYIERNNETNRLSLCEIVRTFNTDKQKNFNTRAEDADNAYDEFADFFPFTYEYEHFNQYQTKCESQIDIWHHIAKQLDVRIVNEKMVDVYL